MDEIEITSSEIKLFRVVKGCAIVDTTSNREIRQGLQMIAI
jgi:hypothetical protein